MSRAQLFIAGFLSLFCLQLHAQKDSVVTRYSTDYEGGAIQSTYTSIIRYRDGKEITNIVIDHGDSLIVSTTYDPNGKPLLRTSREIALDYRENPVQKSPWVLPEFSEDSSPEYEEYLVYNTYYYDTTVFYDLMEVKNSIYHGDDFTNCSNDTIYYYPNHQVKEERRYAEGKLNYTKEYRYVYDDQGRPVKTFTLINDRGSITSTEMHHIYDGEKPYETYRKSFTGDDSLHFNLFERVYDDRFNQIAYRWFQNGVFYKSGTSQFDATGHMIENNTYHADSSREDHHEYRWKCSPSITEFWMSQDYEDDRGYNGLSYARHDTIRTPETIKVRSSGRRIEDPAQRFNSFKAADCLLDQLLVYDRQKRLLEVKNFDETGKVSSIITYTYSRE